MVLWRGRRGFVSVLWCVTSESFDRVRRPATRGAVYAGGARDVVLRRGRRSALRCLTWSEQTFADASSAEPVLPQPMNLEQLRRREGRPVSDVRASARLRYYIHGLLTAHLASAAALRVSAQAAALAQARNSLGCAAAQSGSARAKKKAKTGRNRPTQRADHAPRQRTPSTLFF